MPSPTVVPTPPDRVGDIAKRIEEDVKSRLAGLWDGRLTKTDRDLIRACCRDAADLQVRALADGSTPAGRDRLLRERAWINAQLCNLVSVQGTEAADAFWDVVRLLVNGAVAVAFAAL